MGLKTLNASAVVLVELVQQTDRNYKLPHARPTAKTVFLEQFLRN